MPNAMMGIGKFAEGLSGGMLQGATTAAGLELMRQKQGLEQQRMTMDQDYKTKHLDLLKTHYDALNENQKNQARTHAITAVSNALKTMGPESAKSLANSLFPTLGMDQITELKPAEDEGSWHVITSGGQHLIANPTKGLIKPLKTPEGTDFVAPKTPQDIEGETGAKIRTDMMMGNEVPEQTAAAAGVKLPAAAGSGSLKVGSTKEEILHDLALGKELTEGQKKALAQMDKGTQALMHSSIMAVAQNLDMRNADPVLQWKKIESFYNEGAKRSGMSLLGQEKQTVAPAAAPQETAKPPAQTRAPGWTPKPMYNPTTGKTVRYNPATNAWEPVQ